MKAAQVEEKPVYRSYVRLGRKPMEATNMVTVNGQKSLTLGIVENAQLKIMDALVPINIHIVDSTKEELLIESN